MVASKKEVDRLTMKIGIDARMLNESGIGRYIRNLLEHLQKLDRVNEYYVFLLKKDFDELKFSPNFRKVSADFKWYGLTEQIKFPRLLNKYHLDLVHFPHFNVPVLYTCKYIVTIHDLIHQHFQLNRATTLNPVTFRIKTLGYKKVFKNALIKSLKIFTPSQSVKDQLVNEWLVDKEKIVVTYEAVEESLIKLSQKMSKLQSAQTIKELKVRRPYIFYVGNVHPHKNVEQLIKAYLLLKKDLPKLKLVLSGKENYFWRRLKNEYQDEGIIYTGFITDKQLVALYKNAEMFVFPSLEEGFGIPILEAFACNCPVVCSDIKVFREVGADAASYFMAGNLTDLIDEIKEVTSNKVLRELLISRGKKRFKDFSWERLAMKTLEVYQKCG